MDYPRRWSLPTVGTVTVKKYNSFNLHRFGVVVFGPLSTYGK